MMRARGGISAASEHAGRLTAAVEALVYAAIFAVAIAFSAMLFGAAAAQAHEARALEQAIELADAAAERFAADPNADLLPVETDGLALDCAIERSPRPFGFLYETLITVREGDSVVYERSASAYRSSRAGGDAL